ncbi:group II intron maturase-specific domain-containing protein [Escherichia coli]|uniref:group II intron maturase-specific domain-containing protein n=1 Tax=Escherichia coli TaxID=562 RepID=UPI0020770B9A|nr:group II intron maturase-specific domain-containing protein [Escherichia coli]
MRIYLRGWKSYFRLAQTPKIFKDLDARGSKANDYRTARSFRTAFTFSELAVLDVTTRSTQFS